MDGPYRRRVRGVYGWVGDHGAEEVSHKNEKEVSPLEENLTKGRTAPGQIRRDMGKWRNKTQKR